MLEAAEGAGGLFAIEDRWLEGKPLAAFVEPEQMRDFRSLLLELAHGHGPVGTSLRLRRRDGEELEVEVEAVTESDGERLEWLLAAPAPEDGARAAVPPPMRGVSLQRLLARLPTGVISVDRRLVVEYTNPAGRVFVGRVQVGRQLPDAFEGFSLRKYAARLFTSTPSVRRMVESPTGRLLELDGIPPDQDGLATLLIHDVTSRERRRRAEQEFAANAAHELRNPIAGIAGALDVLQGGAKEVPADRDRFLDHIERETARLTRLVDALLLLARIQTGQERPSLRLVELPPLLQEIAAQLEPQEGVKVSVKCPAHVAVLADEELIRQAIWNVAANAATHTAEGAVLIEGRDVGAFAEVEIRDTGGGIAPEQVPHVFDRFYRAPGRPPGGGFGLGLPIARAIARELGGNVTLASELGVGTRVRVQVPSARVVA